MAHKPSRKPTVDLTRITEIQRQQMERVVQIGARIGLDQQKRKREIEKAIARNFDVMIDSVDEQTRRAIFTALFGCKRT